MVVQKEGAVGQHWSGCGWTLGSSPDCRWEFGCRCSASENAWLPHPLSHWIQGSTASPSAPYWTPPSPSTASAGTPFSPYRSASPTSAARSTQWTSNPFLQAALSALTYREFWLYGFSSSPYWAYLWRQLAWWRQWEYPKWLRRGWWFCREESVGSSLHSRQW